MIMTVLISFKIDKYCIIYNITQYCKFAGLSSIDWTEFSISESKLDKSPLGYRYYSFNHAAKRSKTYLATFPAVKLIKFHIID